MGKAIVAVMEEVSGGLTDKTYCEPFCGMCGVARRVQSKRRVLRDLRWDLILFLRAVRDGWTPPTEMTEEQYKAIRDGSTSALRGFAGVSGSFGGKWFGGFARGNGRNFIAEGSRGAISLGKDLQGSTLQYGGYQRSGLTEVTYCDPPYFAGTSYDGLPEIDHGEFWWWAFNRPGLVFISEYMAPSGAEEVWRQTRKVSFDQACKGSGAGLNRTERLFLIDNR